MTRKQRDKMALRLALDYLDGADMEFRFGRLTRADISAGVRYALIGGPAPPWWAEVVYEYRAAYREDQEEIPEPPASGLELDEVHYP